MTVIRKATLLSVAILLFVVTLYAQSRHTVLFYNVENLFDTINDRRVKDGEFTPRGKGGWNSAAYWQKISNISRVIGDISKQNGLPPTLIGLAEVENIVVLNDLAAVISSPSASYSVAHYDSSDPRGIDVALLYRSDLFKIEGSAPILVGGAKRASQKTPHSRDDLSVWGKIQGEEFFVVVSHWPSRLSGDRSVGLRDARSLRLRHVVDSVRMLRPDTKFVLMGDYNDNPNDRSLRELLGVECRLASLTSGDLFNPFYEIYAAGYGSHVYRLEWNLFDNIILSENLVLGDDQGLKLQPSITAPEFYGEIFKPSYLITKDGRFRGYPYRSFSGGKFTGGYSDHLPIFINLSSETTGF